MLVIATKCSKIKTRRDSCFCFSKSFLILSCYCRFTFSLLCFWLQFAFLYLSSVVRNVQKFWCKRKSTKTQQVDFWLRFFLRFYLLEVLTYTNRKEILLKFLWLWFKSKEILLQSIVFLSFSCVYGYKYCNHECSKR